MSKNYEPDARYRYRRDSYTKGDVDTLLDGKANVGDAYTKAEADALLDEKADTSDTYTKSEVDALIEESGGEKAVVEVSGTSYVISASDAGKWLRFTSQDPVFVVWPIEAEFATGQEVELFRIGGPVTVFSEWAQDVRFNGEDDFRLNAKYTQVRAVNGALNEWDCTYSGDVVFGVYQSPYYISNPGSDPSPIPWTPAEITTALWLDASDSATITLASGAVSQWDDKSGNDRHATQGTAGARPAYFATGFAGGLPAIDYAGSAKVLFAPRGFITDEFSVFLVHSGGSANQRVVDQRGLGGVGDVKGWVIRNFQSSLFDVVLVDNGSGGSRRNNESGQSSAARIASVVFPVGGNAEYYRNGSGVTNYQNIGALPTDIDNLARNIAIGGNADGSSIQDFSGLLCEVIIIAGVADTTTRQLIEGYLAWKWGIEDDLPALHPYKSAPPTL